MIKIVLLSFISSFFFTGPVEARQHDPIELYLETVIEDGREIFISRINDAAITPEGHILITDSAQNKVSVFNEDGTYVRSFGREGRGPGEFKLNYSIEIDGDGTIFVDDLGNARISVWSPEFELIGEFSLMSGLNSFKRTEQDVFIWSNPFLPMPSGSDAIAIYRIHKDPWRAEIYKAFEYNDYAGQHDVLGSRSRWVVTEDGRLIATEGTDEGSYYLYILDEDGEVVHRFGKEVAQTFFTEERSREFIRNGQMVETAERAGSGGVSQRRGTTELVPKPHFKNIEIDARGYLWVHRNKEFGQQEEIDIYTLDGEFKTMITFPPGEDEYRMLGIYGNKILFRVTDPLEIPSLHVYRIEYVEGG